MGHKPSGVFIGQAVNMLEQKKPDHKPCRNSRTTTVAVQRRDLAVDEVPVDLARELHQLVPHVDDLVQPRAKQIKLLSSGASSAASFPSDTATESRFPIRGNPENEIASFQGLRP